MPNPIVVGLDGSEHARGTLALGGARAATLQTNRTPRGAAMLDGNGLAAAAGESTAGPEGVATAAADGHS